MTHAAKTILVIGATGRSGGLTARALVDAGCVVRALVRNPRDAARARANGATQIAIGDLRDAPSLDAALAGAYGVYHVGPPFAVDEAALGITLVAASIRARTRKVVFSSVIHPANGLANHASKLPVERAIMRSGLDYTILYPATLFQNFASGWEKVVREGVYAEPFASDVALARVDYRDVAEVVAEAFTADRLAYGTFELAADNMHDRDEIASMMSRALQRPITVATPSFEDWVRHTPLALDTRTANALKRVYQSYDAFGSPGNGLVLRTLLRRAPRSLFDYFQELATIRWASNNP